MGATVHAPTLPQRAWLGTMLAQPDGFWAAATRQLGHYAAGRKAILVGFG
jgi:hypothetical protein